MSIVKTMQGLRSLAAEGCRLTLEPMLYNAGIHAYAAGVKVASLRNRKAKKMVTGQKETFNRLMRAIDSWREPVIWLHAASLGEFEQGRPVMEEIRRRQPDTKIVLSFFSPSGYEVRHNWNGADVVVYLPFDTPGNVKRFLDIVRPSKAIFVKYEFWRNYLYELSRRNIPTYLISAVFRPDQKFFRRSTAWYCNWLRLFLHIYVQDERSRSLLAGVGIKNVTVAGDTRFDRVTDIMKTAREVPEVETFLSAQKQDRPIFIVGSSWPEDEAVYSSWVNTGKVTAIIAPHEFDDRRLEKMRQLFPSAVLYSELKSNPGKAEGAQTLIMDCFGLLSSAYRYGDIAYVGGGFGAGLHNINEAAVYGMPVIYGPNNSKFIEARELAEAGGGFPVNDGESFTRTAELLLTDFKTPGRKAASYIEGKLGATQRICNDLSL